MGTFVRVLGDSGNMKGSGFSKFLGTCCGGSPYRDLKEFSVFQDYGYSFFWGGGGSHNKAGLSYFWWKLPAIRDGRRRDAYPHEEMVMNILNA